MDKYQQDDVEKAGRERKDSTNGAAGEKGKSSSRKMEKNNKKKRRNTLNRKNVIVLKNSTYLLCWDDRHSTKCLLSYYLDLKKI